MRMLFVLMVVGSLIKASDYFDVDFYTSMGEHDPYFRFYYGHCMTASARSFFALACFGKPCAERMQFLQLLYEKNHPTKLESQKEYKIPPVIHIIWLGNKFPEKYQLFRKSWFTHHPTWTHILWVDNPQNYSEGEYFIINNLEDFKKMLLNGVFAGKSLVIDVKNIKLFNAQFYDETKNYGEKSDMLRYELLYMFGGLYVDTDEECLKPFDILHKTYDSYIAIQPLDVSLLGLGIFLMASIAGHPILRHCIDTIKDDRDIKEIWMKTGPVHFTKSFFALIQYDPHCNIAFPATYFCPVGFRLKVPYEEKRKLFKQESMAVHWWESGWS
jgi:hypothetical protein